MNLRYATYLGLLWLLLFKSYCQSSLQSITHLELLQNSNPVIQKISRIELSSNSHKLGAEIQSSIREQLDIFDKRLNHLELEFDSHEQRKSNTQLYSSLLLRVDQRNNLKRERQAISRSFGLMELTLGVKRHWNRSGLRFELRDLSSISGPDTLFNEAYSDSGGPWLKHGELSYDLSRKLRFKASYAPIETGFAGLFGFEQWRDDPQSVGQLIIDYQLSENLPIRLTVSDLKNLEDADFFDNPINQGWDYGFFHLDSLIKNIYGGDLRLAWLQNRDIPRSMIPNLLPGQNYLNHFVSRWTRRGGLFDWCVSKTLQTGVGRRRAMGEFDFRAWMFELATQYKTTQWGNWAIQLQAFSGDKVRGRVPGYRFEGFVPVAPAFEGLLGKADVLGPSNVLDTQLSWKLKTPQSKLSISADMHDYRLVETSSGALLLTPSLRQTRVGIQNPDLPASNQNGDFNSEIGQELNLELCWEQSKQTNFKLGYAKFWGGKYFTANKPVNTTGPKLNTAWLQAEFLF